MKTLVKFIFIVALMVLFASLGATPTRAATINVGCDATELINAISSASASAEADTLELAASCEYLLAAGLPDIASEITINGNGATIEPGEGFRLLKITASGVLGLTNAVLRGAATECGLESDGAAIHNSGGKLALVDVTFSGNSAGDAGCHSSGGSIWNGEGGELTIMRGNFVGGYAPNGGAISNRGKLTVQDTTFSENRALTVPSFWGSGGSIDNDGEATITGSVFEGGSADGGGGISNTGDLSVSTSIFRGNGWRFGGGILNRGSARVTLTLFEGNYAPNGHNNEPGHGGAIDNVGELTLGDSTILDNRASKGGGIYNHGVMDVYGTTIAGNSAHYDEYGGVGGGIFNEGILRLVNSTIAENHAKKGGGGILNRKELVLDNTTIAMNSTGGSGGNMLNKGKGTVSAANTLFTDGDPQNCVGSIKDRGGNLRYPHMDLSCLGIFGDPGLGPLQNNGGPTHTMALAPDSPAINAARDANCPTADQRGIARPQGKHCDIGAFELQPPSKSALRKPPDGTEFSTPEVNLKWTAAERVAQYQVIVRQDSPKGKRVVKEEVTTTQYKTPGLEGGHWYFWRIKACSKVTCISQPPWQFGVE